MKIPGYWADETKLGPVNGVIWFRKKVNIPSSMTGKPAKIILGRIVDADSVFINGEFVGTTSYLYPRRTIRHSSQSFKRRRKYGCYPCNQ